MSRYHPTSVNEAVCQSFILYSLHFRKSQAPPQSNTSSLKILQSRIAETRLISAKIREIF
jgi:hypothetical protein